MTFTAKNVTDVARLARIAIEEKDIPSYAHNLSNILDMVAEMNAVDTTDIMPMAHPLDKSQRLRHDEITEPNQRDYFQKIAPQTEGGLYLVPIVIE